jgi:hypothetical protein
MVRLIYPKALLLSRLEENYHSVTCALQMRRCLAGTGSRGAMQYINITGERLRDRLIILTSQETKHICHLLLLSINNTLTKQIQFSNV